MKKSENMWANNPLNRITFNGQNYKGAIYYNGVEFSATLNYQTNGKYVMRGVVSAISPVTGYVMSAHAQGENGQKIEEMRVSAEVYANGMDEGTAKKAILNSAMKLYKKYALTIARELQIAARPDTITPCVAAVLYADAYLAKNHSDLMESTAKKYSEQIKKFYACLPQTPMATMKATPILNELKQQGIGKDQKKRLHEFWQYLLECGHTTGVNPVPTQERKKPSPKSKQDSVDRIDELTLEQQDKLFKVIMDKKRIHGGDCGVALSAWGGFNVEDGKTWADLDVRDALDSFAIMKHRRDDLAGATHTYDRPLFPQATQILLRCKEQLLERYSEQQLRSIPIVGMIKNPTKPMASSYLIQYAGKLLREVGIKEAVFTKKKKDDKTAVSKNILHNTYCKNLYLRIGLTWDEDALQYLQGLSLRGKVTDDNYTSFSDEDAMERLFAAMKTIQPEKEFYSNDRLIKENGAGKSVSVLPQKTREKVGAVGQLVLQPGARARIKCRHGVEGQLSSRELLPDGNKKRASRKKQ